jgi:uncharacterized cupredoxin-like copper-binding protein
MRRRLFAVAAVTALALAVAGQASAFHCFVVKKPIGSGSAATLTFDVTSGGEPDFGSLPFNPNSGRVQGGFITLRVVAGTTEIGTWDLVFQNTVGGQAHAAGPDGANECDGVGMEDLLACLGIPEE